MTAPSKEVGPYCSEVPFQFESFCVPPLQICVLTPSLGFNGPARDGECWKLNISSLPRKCSQSVLHVAKGDPRPRMGTAGGHQLGKFEPRMCIRILECSGNTDGQVQPQSQSKLNLRSLKLCFYKLPGDSVILCKCGPAGLVHLYLSTEKSKTRNTRQELGLQPCPLKFWLETSKIRKHRPKPSLMSLPRPGPPRPPHLSRLQLQHDGGSELLTALSPGHD